jgi:hypothetical protein
MADHKDGNSSSTVFLQNLIAVLAAVLSLGCIIGTVALTLNPNLPINPFPPHRQTALSLATSPSPESTVTTTAPEAVTPSAAVADQPTTAPTPTWTVLASLTPTRSPAPTSLTPTSVFPFLLAKAGIRTSVAYQGCAWQGVAGQVFDPLGTPIPNLQIHLEGILDGKSLSQNATTAHLPIYGDGAYVFTLGETPLPSENTIWIQLLDNTKRELSDRIYLKTYEGCDRNLVLVDFQQVAP